MPKVASLATIIVGALMIGLALRPQEGEARAPATGAAPVPAT